MSAVQLRRSGRRRTTTTKASSNILDDVHLTEDEEWQELDEEEDDDGATQQRRTKRQKTKGSSRLSALPEMPLDILFEIMKYLKPLDLLRMARTTKDLRSILMKRSALSVWKSARANVSPLPDCPEGVSEPAFANFMFTTYCHVCLAPRAAYSFAARCAAYCEYCIDQKVIWKPYSDPDLLSTLPGGRATSHHLMYAYYTRTDMVWLQQDYDDLLKEYQEFPDSATKAEDFLELKKSTVHDIAEREEEYLAWVHQETSRAVRRHAMTKGRIRKV